MYSNIQRWCQRFKLPRMKSFIDIYIMLATKFDSIYISMMCSSWICNIA